MYTKLEILEIFNSAKDFQDFDRIVTTFIWLIENKLETRSEFLIKTSLQVFQRLT